MRRYASTQYHGKLTTDSTLATAVTHFRAAAEEFCALIERVVAGEVYTPTSFIVAVEPRLVQLYSRVLELPDLDPSDDTRLPRPITHDTWANTFKALAAALGPYQRYWEVYNPVAREADDVVSVSLADDLADIYRDLKNSLPAAELSDATGATDLVWEWRATFAEHWGQHLIDALRAIHWLRYDQHVGDPDFAPDEA